jgi:hypothetical protein
VLFIVGFLGQMALWLGRISEGNLVIVLEIFVYYLGPFVPKMMRCRMEYSMLFGDV